MVSATVENLVQRKIHVAMHNYKAYMRSVTRLSEDAMQFTDTFEKAQAKLVAMNTKAVELAEEQTKAAFAYTRDVLAAKTPEAFWAVQQNFMKTQQDAATKQFEAMQAFYGEWMKDAAAPVADVVKAAGRKAA
jgi:hypothetical protein